MFHDVGGAALNAGVQCGIGKGARRTGRTIVRLVRIEREISLGSCPIIRLAFERVEATPAAKKCANGSLSLPLVLVVILVIRETAQERYAPVIVVLEHLGLADRLFEALAEGLRSHAIGDAEIDSLR